MTTLPLQIPAVSLQIIPATLLFSEQMPLPSEAPGLHIRFGCEVMESLTTRANQLTETLTEIPGYDHFGINE